MAELLRILASDSELRDELRARGRRRVADFDAARTAERMRAALEGLAA